MSSIIKVDTIQNQSGANIISESANTITVGASGDTVTVPSGATFDVSSATVTGTGINEADNWRLTTNYNPSTGTQIISSNWEREDTYAFSLLGTGMTESSGVFSFPSTGYWLIMFHLQLSHTGSNHYTTAAIQVTENNSTYNPTVEANFSLYADGNRYYSSGLAKKILDVTNISNVKVRFTHDFQQAGARIDGNSNTTKTSAMFIRLGDT